MKPELIVDVVTVRRLAASGDARRIRVTAGVSMSEIAAACAVSPSTVLRWENGQRRPRGSAATRWLRILRALEEVVAATNAGETL